MSMSFLFFKLDYIFCTFARKILRKKWMSRPKTRRIYVMSMCNLFHVNRRKMSWRKRFLKTKKVYRVMTRRRFCSVPFGGSKDRWSISIDITPGK